jgi:iron complex outermembrane recepter protein
MSNSLRAALAATTTLAWLSAARAAEPPQPAPLFLGEIEATAPRVAKTVPGTVTTVDTEYQREFDLNRLSQTLETLPGVSTNPGNRGGSRNEVGVFIRGFDQSRVPLLLDGIPIYVPYDGYVDLNRFLTGDFTRVEISKGYTSVLYGPGALGGAINLITRKPERPFEGDASLSVVLDNRMAYSGLSLTTNLGARRGDWYVMGSVQENNVDHTRLPDSFKGSLYQPAGDRLRSDSQDFRVSGRIGYAPDALNEYVLGFAVARGQKGAPPYAGWDPTKATFFDWPYWDEDNIYFLGRTAVPLGTNSYVKFRLYYDGFRNSLYRYDNVTYTTQKLPFAFSSQYDDYSFGGSVEVGTDPFEGNTTKAAVHLRQDTHREFGPTTPRSTMQDATYSVALESTQRLAERLTLTIGLSEDLRTPISAQDPSLGGTTSFTVTDQSAFNIQGGVRWGVRDDTDLFASLGRRARFATMFERYSYRLGNGLPNAGLRPERATKAEIGFETRIIPMTNLTVSLFNADVDDFIQAVTVGTRKTPPFGAIVQNQNVGNARFGGVEVDLRTTAIPRTILGANYTWLDREPRGSQSSAPYYGTPRHKGFIWADVDVGAGFSVTPSVLLESSRKTTDTGDGLPVQGFAVLNLKGVYHITENVQAELASYNLLDQRYAYDSGYPMPGRTVVLTTRVRF